MGFQTSLVVLNDALSYIEEDQDFGRKVSQACLRAGSRGIGLKRPIDIDARRPQGGVHCNAASVVETHHADGQVLVAFGGNTATSFGYVGNWTATEEDMLRALADKMGYRLVRKPQK